MELPFGSNPNDRTVTEVDVLADILDELKSIKEATHSIRQDVERIWREVDRMEDRGK